jgi:signal transduction histidine kinase
MTNIPQDSSRAEIDALSEAVRAVTADLSLERVLRRIAEIAARLVNARYAALGVPDGKGGLENFFVFGMTEKQISQMDHLPRGLGLLGLLLVRPEPIRLADMRQDERSAGFCEHHPKMTSFLGVPIISKGQHLGNLYLSDRLDGQPFSGEDERLITLLAGHAAVAIENARLSEQLRKLAVVEERDRIAMELHDGIIQAIYAIGLRLENARTTKVIVPEVDAEIRAATQDLNHVIEDLRRYIQDLKVGVNYSLDLHQQLREIAEGFRSVSSARLVLDVAPGFTHLTEARVHTIVQVMRETLSNIVRHANATEVYVDLHETAAQITLAVSDNGRGFDPAKVTQGRGLENMRRRAEQLGGTLDIRSQTGRGATLTLNLPR